MNKYQFSSRILKKFTESGYNTNASLKRTRIEEKKSEYYKPISNRIRIVEGEAE